MGVMESWTTLKALRTAQAYVTSRLSLDVYSLAAPVDDRAAWEADVSDELEELRHHSVNLHEDYHRQVRRESPDLGPEPPTWNEEQMRDALIQQALQQRRNPNDPIRTIVMDSDGVALSPFEQITDSADRRRMEHIINSKYVVKLFYNGALVTQSDPLRITESLTIQDGRSYPIRTADRPKSVKLEIVESGGRFKSKSFGESILVLPGSDQTQPPLAERITKFPERQAVATASGGGGAVVTALHWGSDDKGFVLAPKNYKSEAIYDHRKPDMHDPELHLYSEGEDIITDQNDPAYQTRDNVDGEEATGYAGFVLNPFMTDGYFCPAEELEKSKRIRFLQLRAQEVSEFVGRTMVPLREHEILDSDFTTYESRIEQSYAETTVDDRRALVRIERQRTKEMVLQRLRAVSKTLSFNEVVVEDPVPEFGALLSNFSKFFEVRRPLRPERKAVKRRVKDQVKEPKIIVSIRNAQNLPVRINKYDEESLKPFVSVSFLDNEERSSVAFGANPSWNEQIELSWATGLSRMLCGVPTLAREEFIFINIFDEDLLISNEGENVFTSQAMKNWIGGVTVPLSSLMTRGVVEGQIHLNVPELLFGYTRENRISPTIDVYITLDANYPSGDVSHQFPTDEKPQMAQDADDLVAQLKKRFPEREFYALVADLKGVTHFVTRYINAINIPTELEHQSLTRLEMASRLARYVSLIPFEADAVNFAARYDLWGDNGDFLSCLQGDEEEHAVLLVSYFLKLDILNPRLLFGYTISNGSCCWVVTEDEGQVQLWDPLTAECYTTSDPKCPLTAVYCAADATNVYYNVQHDVRPNRISWNFDTWTKLWSGSSAATAERLETIQVSTFDYAPPHHSLRKRRTFMWSQAKRPYLTRVTMA